MFGRDAGAIVLHADLGGRGVVGDRNFNRSARGRVVRRVFHQVVYRAAKKHFVGYERRFTLAPNREVLLLGDQFVERRDFLDRGAAIEGTLLEMAFGCLGSGKEKQIVDDVAQMLALGDRRFNHFAIFFGGTRPGERDFRFATDIADGGAKLVGKVGRTITALRPAGAVDVEGRRVDVVAEGVFVDAGREVRVVSVEGARVVVIPVDSTSQES